jgi:high-affinity Fe2+/Pb2+ permease
MVHYRKRFVLAFVVASFVFFMMGYGASHGNLLVGLCFAYVLQGGFVLLFPFRRFGPPKRKFEDLEVT